MLFRDSNIFSWLRAIEALVVVIWTICSWIYGAGQGEARSETVRWGFKIAWLRGVCVIGLGVKHIQKHHIRVSTNHTLPAVANHDRVPVHLPLTLFTHGLYDFRATASSPAYRGRPVAIVTALVPSRSPCAPLPPSPRTFFNHKPNSR